MSKNYDMVLQLENITHGYQQGEKTVDVLQDMSFTLHAGEICALTGPSGSGKSTLLQLAGLLEKPQKGQVLIDGTDCTAFDDNQKSSFRSQKIGFVFQFHRLLPEMTAFENILLPQLFINKDHKTASERAHHLLERIGLSHRKDHLPAEMSGGEQQRAAIARALANKPLLLLADEPTGNLDPSLSDHIFLELTSFVRSEGAAALIATHNMDLAARADRNLNILGRV
ncbi:MAG: ABC transporter ATP-binding protein [Pseudomonadota bacterium]